MGENNGGWFFGLLAGAGIASAIVVPFYIGYRFGLHILAAIFAILATLLAVFSPELMSMAAELIKYDSSFGALYGRLLIAISHFGWWWVAGLMWAYAILTQLMFSLGWMPKAFAGHK